MDPVVLKEPNSVDYEMLYHRYRVSLEIIKNIPLVNYEYAAKTAKMIADNALAEKIPAK